MLFVFLLYALFSSVFIICKITLEYTEPLFLVGARMLFAGVLILFYQFVSHSQIWIVHRANIVRLLCLAFFNIYISNVCEVWGLKFLSSAKACLIYSLAPFIAALLSFFMFNEKISLKKWTGLTIGFIGFFPIVLFYKLPSEELTGSFWVFSWPELALVTAAASSVYGWILLKQLVKEEGFSPLLANGWSMLIGGSMALVHSFFVENWDPFPVTNYVSFFECSLSLLIISNLICYNLYGVLLKRYSATFLSFAGFTTPLFTAALGWIFLDEQIVSISFYASMVVVFFGLMIFFQEELKEGYTVQKTPQPAIN